MNTHEKELAYYSHLNRVSCKGGVVLFGSTFAKNIPVSELSQTFGLDCHVYNRSFYDLSIPETQPLCEEVVMKMQPRKILFQLGETDMANATRSLSETMEAYERLIAMCRRMDKRVKIVIASICSAEPAAADFNSAIEALARRCKCPFVDISDSISKALPSVTAFSTLRCFIPDTLSLTDVMGFSSVC